MCILKHCAGLEFYKRFMCETGPACLQYLSCLYNYFSVFSNNHLFTEASEVAPEAALVIRLVFSLQLCH